MDNIGRGGKRDVLICRNNHHFAINTDDKVHTCSICGDKIDTSEEKDTPKTPEQLEDEAWQQEKDRVCGWLVCISGPNMGTGYVIRSGKNYIGSDPNMDIYIKGDRRIDKMKHACVMYDPKTRKTMLLPGDSQGMVYVNDKAIYAPHEVAPNIEIEIGNSHFFFVPFCVEYDWFDFEQRNKERQKLQ